MPTNPMTQREMQPLTSVFGGTKNTPRAVFERSRTENAGTVVATRANDMAMACPRCAAAGDKESRMFSRADSGYYCLKGHKWNDYDELMAMDPAKMAFKGIVARQDGWEKLPVDLPGSVKSDLEKKFGDRLQATIRAVLETLAQSKCLMVPEEDLKRLNDHTGMDLKNSSQLVGAVYSLKQTNTNLEESNRLMKNNRGGGSVSPTAIVVELGDLCAKVIAKANERETTPGEVITTVVEQYAANDWM